MTKNQKMLLGVGAVAVVGYLLWKKQQTAFTGNAGERTFFNASGTSKIAAPKCGCVTSCTTSSGPNTIVTTTGTSITGSSGSSMFPSGICMAVDAYTQDEGGHMVPYAYVMRNCSTCSNIPGTVSVLAKFKK